MKAFLVAISFTFLDCRVLTWVPATVNGTLRIQSTGDYKSEMHHDPKSFTE